MSRFSQIARGPTQIEEIELTFSGAEQPTKIGVRVIGTDQDDDILKGAREFAIKAGIANPKEGDPIYDVALARETIARGCVDLDDRVSPFFASAEEVRIGPDGKGGLDRDRIAYIAAKQRAWQDKCSPSRKSMKANEFIAKVLEIAGASQDDERPFDSLEPALHKSFTRTLAREYVSSVMHKSPSSSDLKPGTESNTKPSLDS